MPNIAPKVFLTFGAFTGLNPGSHGLEFIPSLGRLTKAVFPQKVGAIHQDANIGVVGYCHQLASEGIARGYYRIL